MERRHLHVTGVVQGVGFRPFVYTLAKRLALTGWVLNNSQGVDIEIEGPSADLDRFLVALRGEAPPLAKIESVAVTPVPRRRRHRFYHPRKPITARRDARQPGRVHLRRLPARAIRPERPALPLPLHQLHQLRPALYDHSGHALRPPDDDDARLYDVPRLPGASTTTRRIAVFTHSPTPVLVCGPNVSRFTYQISTFHSFVRDWRPLTETRQWLAEGKIVAVKGIGGFHLACDATNDEAVAELRRRKGRVDKPFAVMMPDVETVERFCELNEARADAAHFAPAAHRPFACAARYGHQLTCRARQNTLGVMLPYSPLALFAVAVRLQPQYPIPNTHVPRPSS